MICNRSATDWYVTLVTVTQQIQYITICYFAPGPTRGSMAKSHNGSHAELLYGW